MPLRDKVSALAIQAGLFVAVMKKSIVRSESDSPKGNPIIAATKTKSIVLNEEDIDLEFDDLPWRRDHTVLLVRDCVCIIASRGVDGELTDPKQVSVAEALRWYSGIASIVEGWSCKLSKLTTLAAALLVQKEEAGNS